MRNPLQIAHAIAQGSKHLEFLPTGFKRLDKHLEGGFMRKEMVVIGADTGVGKSYIANQICYNVARHHYKTAIFSLEISGEMIVARLLGQLAGVKSGKIRSNVLSQPERLDVRQATESIAEVNKTMDVYDDLYEYEEVVNIVRNGDYDLVVVDYLQNVDYPAPTEHIQLAKVARGLQKLAKEKDCVILCLSQLSTEMRKKENKDTDYLEFKGSGSIKDACDLAFYLTRDFDMATFNLSLRKNRRGERGEFQLVIANEGGRIDESY